MQQSRLWTRTFTLVCLCSFFVFMNFYTLATSLPIIVAKHWNGNQSHIGLAMTVFIVAALLFRPIVGSLAGVWSPRALILTSVIFFLAASLLYPAVNGLLILFVLRFLHGSSFGMASTATSAVAADLVPASRKGEGIGSFSLFTSLAMVIGPFVGLSVTGSGNPSLLFVMCGAFSVAALICAVLAGLPVAARKPAASGRAQRRKMTWRALIEPAAVPISLTGFFLAFAYSGITSFISVYADELGIASSASLFFVCFAALIVIPRPFVGKLFDRIGPNILVYPSVVVFAAGMLLLAFAHSVAVFLVSGAVIGLGYGILLPIFQTIAVQAAPAERSGLATSTYWLLLDTGFGLGSILLGMLAMHTKYSGVYLTSSAVVALTALFYYLLHHSADKRKTPTEAVKTVSHHP
ncbi:MFS transporter [Paenibacillus xanthanilyticus]|uniref:MFS transporter n=1 Tax=Paenibacillus xanthanilyticus TaxID=1783531 RepID=A0ABV8K9Q0_9BACL